METDNKPSKGATITGWILTGLTSFFFLMDGIMKIAKAQVSVQGSAELGWPVDLVPAIGYILTVFTALHLFPRTAFLGALLITAYLGGSVAILMAAGKPAWFSIVMGFMMWLGYGLRQPEIRRLFF